MSDQFSDQLKAQLRAAILAALEAEGVEVASGATATISNSTLGEAEIPLT